MVRGNDTNLTPIKHYINYSPVVHRCQKDHSFVSISYFLATHKHIESANHGLVNNLLHITHYKKTKIVKFPK